MSFKCVLPRKKFFFRKLISSTNFLAGYFSSLHSRQDSGFASDRPSSDIGWRKLSSHLLLFRRASGDDRKNDLKVRHNPI
jgi:hypothetical protein